MSFKKLSHDDKLIYIIKPILHVLQEAGGQLTRSEIKDRITELDDELAEFAEIVKTSKRTGATYRDFNYKVNFAIKYLSLSGFLTFRRGAPITLTDKGINVDLSKLNVQEDVVTPGKIVQEQISQERRERKAAALDDNDLDTPVERQDELQSEEKLKDDFKDSLLTAIAKMSPKKFEAFSRALLTRMGVEFTDRAVQISKDGGIDGYGYHTDTNDFRTTRVVIQCKRYNSSPVTEPEINQFLGAMNKFQADYGVFITNGRFTSSARTAAREGSPITLIDGNDLVNLVIRYELYITPVKTYVLDEFYEVGEE